ncbi:MAG: linoleoyl-CoA desaturase, partial [Flavobacteriales bacterium]
MTNHGLPTQDTLVRFGNREQAAFFSTLRKRVDGYFKENKISRHADARMVSKTVIL